MLNFDNRFDVDTFLKENGAFYQYTSEELAGDTAALQNLLQKHNR